MHRSDWHVVFSVLCAWILAALTLRKATRAFMLMRIAQTVLMPQDGTNDTTNSTNATYHKQHQQHKWNGRKCYPVNF